MSSPLQPPPPREQLCNRYCSNKHTPAHTAPMPDQHSSDDASAAVLSGASTSDRHAVANGVHVERPAPAAQETGNLRSRLAAAGQTKHAWRVGAARGGIRRSFCAEGAQWDRGREVSSHSQTCIKVLSYTAARLTGAQELKTLMHIVATIDSVGFGQCSARALSRSRARKSVSKQCPAQSQAIARSRAGEGGSRRCVHHTLPDSPAHIACKDRGSGAFQGKNDQVRSHQFLAALRSPSLRSL